MKIKDLLALIRPQQWLRNLFVFLPLFFSSNILNPVLLINGFGAFVAFSFIASSIYCFNDLYDADYDRLHPKKKNRPVASGRVGKGPAYLLMVIMFLLSVFIVIYSFGFDFRTVFAIILFYFFLNIAYTVFLKKFAIIDVFIIALGFVLRLMAGGEATGVILSHWIVIMTFLLALFLGFSKRKDDIRIYEADGIKARKNILRYNADFLNQTISIIATITIISYIMYTVSGDVVDRIGNQYLYLTSIFVLLGILRYLQLSLVDKTTGNPTEVLIKDRFIQLSILGWIISFIIILYV